jgi:hypothetical protein
VRYCAIDPQADRDRLRAERWRVEAARDDRLLNDVRAASDRLLAAVWYARRVQEAIRAQWFDERFGGRGR